MLVLLLLHTLRPYLQQTCRLPPRSFSWHKQQQLKCFQIPGNATLASHQTCVNMCWQRLSMLSELKRWVCCVLLWSRGCTQMPSVQCDAALVAGGSKLLCAWLQRRDTHSMTQHQPRVFTVACNAASEASQGVCHLHQESVTCTAAHAYTTYTIAGPAVWCVAGSNCKQSHLTHSVVWAHLLNSCPDKQLSERAHHSPKLLHCTDLPQGGQKN